MKATLNSDLYDFKKKLLLMAGAKLEIIRSTYSYDGVPLHLCSCKDNRSYTFETQKRQLNSEVFYEKRFWILESKLNMHP